jgi:hypothetical protein
LLPGRAFEQARLCPAKLAKAMIDISDGLLQDLAICKASKVAPWFGRMLCFLLLIDLLPGPR